MDSAIHLYQKISDSPEKFDAKDEDLISSEICSSVAHTIEKVIESSCLEQGINLHQSKNYHKSIDYRIEKSPELVCFIAEEWNYVIKGKHFKLDYQVEVPIIQLNCPDALATMLQYMSTKTLAAAKSFHNQID